MITRKHSVLLATVVAVLAATGCAHKKDKLSETHQFTPAPTANVGAQELKPVKPPATTELLKVADEAFRRGNAAQEKGDKHAALKEYNRFLELLIEADLDPIIFYNLRAEFGRILNSTTEHARLFDEINRRKLTPEELAFANVVGDLEIVLNDRVIAEIEEIQNYYPRNYQGGLNRSGKYMHHIRREFLKAGLPTDLAWLAMVESQFTPKIVSRAGAGGMWQFMKETGRRYGLRVDNYVDDRYNWEKSTQAAILYLTDLRDRFDGNWPLAVSSYNMGEYGMERAIAANGGETDLWKLIETAPASNRMQEETKKFYPKLLASIIVAANPEKYGFQNVRQTPDRYVRVPVKGSYSLAVLDRSSGLPEGTLASLNPDLIRGVTPPNNEHLLAVPVEASEKLLASLANLPEEKRSGHSKPVSSALGAIASLSPIGKGGLTQHLMRRGETLSEIAERYGVPVADLMKANKIRSSRQVPVGTRLTIPHAEKETPAASGVSKPETPNTPKKGATGDKAASTGKSAEGTPGPRTYTVKTGDTLYDIAKLQGVPIKELQKLNSLGNSTSLRVGDTLVVASRGTKSGQATTPGKKTTHVVKTGEFPGKIARQYDVNVDDFLRWNNLSKKSQIKAGDKLIVYSPEAPSDRREVAKAETKTGTPLAAATKDTEKIMHKVAKGETPSSVAAKYGVSVGEFLSWNKLSGAPVIKVGQEYVVYPQQKSAIPAASETAAPAKKAEPVAAEPAVPKGKKVTHSVSTGQNPTTIARRYGVKVSDLFTWNGWTKDQRLQVGDKVIVYTK